MITGGFVQYCLGLTTEYDGIDVFVARPVLAYLSRFPALFGDLEFSPALGETIGDRMFEVLDISIGDEEQNVQVPLTQYLF